MKKVNNFVLFFGKFFLVLLLLAGIFVYAMFQGGFVSWFLFFSFLPFVCYSLILAIYPIRFFEVERTINQSQFIAGEKLTGTITIRRKYPLPLLYILIEETLPASLLNAIQSKRSKIIVFSWFKRSYSYEYIIESIPRGEFKLSNIRVKTGDFLGLIEKERNYTAEHSILVYPKCIDMIYSQGENQFEQGMTSSRLKVHRETAVTTGVREYRNGDRFSWIDWKSTARKNTIMTKEFEQQQSNDIVVFFDQSRSVAFEHSVTFAASVTNAILQRGSQIGFISIGKENVEIPLGSGGIQKQQIQHHLARVKAEEEVAFTAQLESEIAKYHRSVSIMLISTHLNEEMMQFMKRMALSNASIIFNLVKDNDAKPSTEELQLIESIEKNRILPKIIYGERFTDVFNEVGRP
ncbi:DUF58 domain-containing protein [Bacillus sp. SCS-151]|uniref:DUF58 domain-containing protein n=1 Tax=Nanhaiella sioensis TaxID=3115293 RepID=UPI00397A6826